MATCVEREYRIQIFKVELLVYLVNYSQYFKSL